MNKRYEIYGISKVLESGQPGNMALVELSENDGKLLANLHGFIPWSGSIPKLDPIHWNKDLDKEGQKVINGLGEPVFFTAAIADLYNFVISTGWQSVQDIHKSGNNPNIHDWLREKIWETREKYLANN